MLRRWLLTISLLMTAHQTWAEGFSYLPANSGAEKEFKTLMAQGNYRGALLAWSSALERSDFADSANGKATYAYLLYQNGLPYFGLDVVLNETQPNRLAPEIRGLWEKEIRASQFVQKGYLRTSGGWRSIVNNEPVQVRIKSKKDIAAAFAKAERAPRDQVNYRARILWQIATLAPQFNETDQALKALKILRESGQTVIGSDLILSATARVLYQKGELEAALQTYQQIPKSSVLWIESVEERAWTHLRRDDFDKAYGETVTLLSPALSPLVGPESYFLTDLLALKACDYPRVFKTGELFKERHRARLVELQEIAKTGSSKNLNSVFDKFEQKGVSLESAGPLIASLPRAALRDESFNESMESRRQILSEIRRAQEVSEFTKTLGESNVLSKVIGRTKSKADRLRQQAFGRVRKLAALELQEYRNMLNKMHIIEAEAIQRLHVDDSLKGERSKLSKNDDGGDDVLVFPYTSDEVWLDELDNYKARVKDCPTAKGASL